LERGNLVYDLVIGPLTKFCHRPWLSKRASEPNFPVILSPGSGYGYIGYRDLHCRRPLFWDYLKAFFTASVVLIKNKLDNGAAQ